MTQAHFCKPNDSSLWVKSVAEPGPSLPSPRYFFSFSTTESSERLGCDERPWLARQHSQQSQKQTKNHQSMFHSFLHACGIHLVSDLLHFIFFFPFWLLLCGLEDSITDSETRAYQRWSNKIPYFLETNFLCGITGRIFLCIHFQVSSLSIL